VSVPPSRWSSPPTRPPTSATRSGTTVTPDYTAKGSRFTGNIHWVQIDLGADDQDHLIDPEERLRVAMARQ
jgi:arylsulfatase